MSAAGARSCEQCPLASFWRNATEKVSADAECGYCGAGRFRDVKTPFLVAAPVALSISSRTPKMLGQECDLTCSEMCRHSLHADMTSTCENACKMLCARSMAATVEQHENACRVCGAGQYQDLVKQTSCEACAAGKFRNANSAYQFPAVVPNDAKLILSIVLSPVQPTVRL